MNGSFKEVVIVSGVRTAIGKMGGSLSTINQADLGGMVIREVVKRANIGPAQVDHVVVGNVGQIAESGFIGRTCSLKGGLPKETTAESINIQCGSGLQAISHAMMMIQNNRADIVVACGTENMSQLPYYIKGARFGYKMGHDTLEDGLIDILTWPMGPFHNGMTAENVADKYHVDRDSQDKFALMSQERALKAISDGIFKDQILPVELKTKKGSTFFDTDEHPREGLSLEKLGKLKPAFKDDGSVTAANSSGINDAAAAVVVMSKEKAMELGITDYMEVVDFFIAGNEPELMGFAPALSTKELLKRNDLTIDDIDLIELNEAFASQSIAVINDVGMDITKVNVNGGAIALGHPVGATGAILTVKMLYELRRQNKKYGIVTMCIGGGQGISMLFKRS